MKKALVLSDASSTHTWTWVEGYKKLNFKVYLLSFEEPINEGIEADEFIKINSPFAPSLKRYLFGIDKIKNYIHRIQPDIIFAHFIPNYGLLSYVQGKIPYVITCWGTDLTKVALKSFLHKKISKQIFKKAKLIVVDAKFMKEIIVNDFKIDPSKIFITPFGIKEEIRIRGKRVKKEKEEIIVFTNRRMEKIYNPFAIINAIKKLENENFKTIWIKRGSLEKKVEELCYRKGIFDKITFLPFQDREELYTLLGKSHIYVSASFYDGTSVSLLEAMTFKLFPIVSDIPGNREWILDGINGFLFDPNDYEELSEKIKRAIHDEDLRKSAAEMNLKIIDAKANWELNLEKFYDMLNKR